MKEREHLSGWRSPAAELRFRSLEDVLWHELWPEPPAALTLPTRLGPTRAYRWPGAGDPVVLLHGTGGTALTWSPYVGRLGRPVVAVDSIGDVGRSHQQAPVRDVADLAGWLADVVDGLGLDRPDLAATSYGGFLALALAAHHPDRVRSLGLVDPAGIAPLRLARFLLWGGAVMASSWLPGPLRRRAARRLRMPLLDDRRPLRMAFYAQRHHRARLLPPVLTDGELQAVAAPALVLAAERSEVFRAAELRARAAALLPDARVATVAGAGHAVVLSHVDEVVDALAAFLGDVRS